MWVIKVWHCNRLGKYKSPKPCKISNNSENQFSFFENGVCKFSSIDSKDGLRTKKYERYLKQCNILNEEDTIRGAMEVISFEDTLRRWRGL